MAALGGDPEGRDDMDLVRGCSRGLGVSLLDARADARPYARPCPALRGGRADTEDGGATGDGVEIEIRVVGPRGDRDLEERRDRLSNREAAHVQGHIAGS